MEDRIKQLEEEVKMWRDRYESLKRWVGKDLENEWTWDDDWTWYNDETTGVMYAKDYQDQIEQRINNQQEKESTKYKEETNKYHEYIKTLNEETYYNSESEGKETRD